MEHIIGVYLCLISCQLIIVTIHPLEREGHGLTTLVCSTCSSMYNRISFTPVWRTYWPPLQTTPCQMLWLPYLTNWLATLWTGLLNLMANCTHRCGWNCRAGDRHWTHILLCYSPGLFDVWCHPHCSHWAWWHPLPTCRSDLPHLDTNLDTSICCTHPRVRL